MTAKRKRSARVKLEIAIEKAIALLDRIDGDADLEPSLGSTSCIGALGPQSQEHWAAGSSDDLEDEHDGREHHQDSWPNPMAG